MRTSATKKYASPVSEYKHRQKWENKAFRRMMRAGILKHRKVERRRSKRHPSLVEGVPGKPFNTLEFKSTREQTHATGALKRSERHPKRYSLDREWQYVCR